MHLLLSFQTTTITLCDIVENVWHRQVHEDSCACRLINVSFHQHKLSLINDMVKLDSSQWRIQDFPEEGAPTLQGGRQHTILPNFPKNCIKLKEFGPPGGGARPKFYYVDPPLAAHTF